MSLYPVGSVLVSCWQCFIFIACKSIDTDNQRERERERERERGGEREVGREGGREGGMEGGMEEGGR